MPRHILKPLPRGNPQARAGPSGSRQANVGMDWSKLDRVQVLGTGRADDGHTGCVNALSWSDDGDILLSGSDDKRVCIWTPDSSSVASSSKSPYPMKLSTSIHTGHRDNIFSAKFLPNAGTPTVVTVAGDHEIRLLEIERLSSSGGQRMDRFQHGAAGVKVLNCHRNRTKKIATENSPFLFMTVAEDGTVRQHDLRRPHRCRSECPDPLFRAPQGVDLYSLSVSTPAPHIFAVAGRTDTAFICDRRMLEKHNPSWGNKVVGSGQVHCVRRLGLPDSEWEKVQPSGTERLFAGERHITCVKMSPEHADEAIVSFQRHSTSLFSIYDDPGTSSARRSASPIIPPNEGSNARQDPIDPTVTLAPKLPIRIRKPSLGKRKKSEMAEKTIDSASAKQKTDEIGAGPSSSEENSIAQGPGWSDEVDPTTGPSGSSSSAAEQDLGLIQDLQEEDLRDLMNEDGDDDGQSVISISTSVISEIFNTALGPVNPEHPTADDRFDDIDRAPPGIFDDDMYDDYDIDADDYGEYEDDEDGGNVDFGLYDDDDDNDGIDDYDVYGGDYGDEFDEEDEDEDDYEDVDDDYDDGDEAMYPDRRSADTEFGGVELIYPRRMFRGAKNIETVKDCNFLGLRSDKVCSGSDDGHFFVWDKDTGRLEGIWEGDGSIVNVMEQHPTLPIVAVSGIDDTIKMFAATLTPPNPSFCRTHLQGTIIKNNTDPNRIHMGSALDRLNIFQLFGAQGLMPSADDPEDDGGPIRPSCETQ